MRKFLVLMAAGVLAGAVQPDAAAAQGSKDRSSASKQQEKREKDKLKAGRVVRDDRDRDDRKGRTDDDDDDRYRGGLNKGEGKGPKFCRTGAGHPVHGRQWCVDKGFGLANSRWDQARWEDVIFRQPQPRTSLDLNRGTLRDILGEVVFNRLDARRRTLGVTTPLSGRWVDSDGRSVMLVNAGALGIAELIDRNRDRRVDQVLLNFGR